MAPPVTFANTAPQSSVGLFLLEAISARQLATIADFTDFVGSPSESIAVFDLVFSTPAAANTLAVRYVLDLQRRRAPPDQQRLHLDALGVLTARAERFRIGRCRLDVNGVFATAAQTPLRAK